MQMQILTLNFPFDPDPDPDLDPDPDPLTTIFSPWPQASHSRCVHRPDRSDYPLTLSGQASRLQGSQLEGLRARGPG